MREMKFRAWHEYGNQTGKHTKPGMIYDEKPGDCLHWKNQGQKIIAVMQFTGLLDKNGKDIYEGDILEIRNPKCQIQKAILRGAVVFEYSSFGVKIKQIAQWEGYSEFASKPNIVWFLNIIDSKEFEVIGNIYEPPVLPKGDGQGKE